MKVYDDGMAQLYHADSRALPLPDESVDCVVTSPPYYSARKYGGGASMVWDAAEGCEHVWGDEIIDKSRHRPGETNPGLEASWKDKGAMGQSAGQFCQRCGAWRGQLGLEPSLELYIAHLMQIADECWRVLKGGVMVWNLGDSYASNPSNQQGRRGGNPASKVGGGDPNIGRQDRRGTGLKPLDLCMVPSRVALALQERGWYLRSVIPWVKRASMPSSERGDRWERCRVKVKAGQLASGTLERGAFYGQALNDIAKDGLTAQWADCPGCPRCLPNDGLVLRHGNWRPGKSLEWLLVLSKTGDYYSDSEGVRVANITLESQPNFRSSRNTNKFSAGTEGVRQREGATGYLNPAGRNRREMDWFYESLNDIIAHHEREARRLKHLREQGGLMWEVSSPLAMLLNPKGYKEAHFATYPPALVEPFIKAYTSDKGNCAECGKPWVRVVERTTRFEGGSGKAGATAEQINATGKWAGKQHGENIKLGPVVTSNTLGWRPQCTCEAGEPTPAIVLDPFAGACSTAIAAGSLGRKSIMIECCEEYLDMAVKRLGGGYSVETEGGVEVKQTQMFGDDMPGEVE